MKQNSLFDQHDTELQSISMHDQSILSPTPMHLPGDQQRLVIRASAGTGKTFQLSNRYLTLLRSATPDRILASTFTRKAAGEIIDRILLRLAKASINDKEFASLEPFAGEPSLTQKECMNLLKMFSQNLHRIRISTLDGFFARLAGSFSLELKLPPSWRLMDELEAAYLQDQAIDHVLREGDVQELKTLMHQLDKGSVRRSVYQLISEHISSFHNIYLQTSEQAWKPFGKLKMPSDQELETSVIRLEQVVVDISQMEKARNTDLEKIANEDWEGLYKNGLLPKVLGDGKYNRKEIPEDLKEAYLELEKVVRQRFLFPWAQQTEATFQLLQAFDNVYERLKRETSGLRFDDVTRRLSQALASRTTSDLSHRLDGSIDHVLLDEFQDTSVPQWNVIHPFAIDTTTSPEKSFFCVGDGKQAIYSWRGGEASIFDTISSQLSNLREEPLNKSFRSSQVIIDAVNQIFRGFGNHDGFGEEISVIRKWSEQFPVHETARTDLPGYFELCTSPMPEGMQLGDRNTQLVTDNLNRFVAHKVQRLLEAHPAGNIGILTRSNARIGEIIFELNQLGIEASEEGGNPITDSAAVRLVLSLLQFADHPGDSVARFHLVNSPLAETIGLTDFDDETLAERVSLEFRRRVLNFGFGRVVSDLIPALVPHCSARELRRLMQLSSLADDFDAIPHSLRSTEFVEFVELQRVQEPIDAAVRVMTIHQSKGLQFDTVIYAECDNQITKTPDFLSWTSTPGAPPDVVALYRSKDFRHLFPPKVLRAFEQTTEKQITEALCLLYVALTRAVHALHVIVAPRTAKSEEKSLPKSAAGLIRAAVAPSIPLEPEVTLAFDGDPRWYESLPAASKKAAGGSVVRTVSVPELQLRKTSSGRRLGKATPSQKESSHQVRLESFLPLGDSRAVDRGSVFHAWMEQIQWGNEPLPPRDQLQQIGLRLGGTPELLGQWLNGFEETISRPGIQRVLSREYYLEPNQNDFPSEIMQQLAGGPCDLKVFNERPFAVRRENDLIRGTIDRLVTISRNGKLIAADIVDYKTDQLPNDLVAIHDRVEFYRGQLEAYVWAAEKFLGLPGSLISARLVLLSLGKISLLE